MKTNNYVVQTIKKISAPAYFNLLVPLARKLQLTRRWEDIYELAMPFMAGVHVKGVVDGGAYHGTHSLRLANLFPHARVYAFEPAYGAFDELSKQAKVNQRIIPIQEALADKKGIATLNINKKRSTSSLLVSSVSDNIMANATNQFGTLERIDVKTISLDEVVNIFPDFSCEFLKLDLQGYEMKALRGARKCLTDTVHAIVAEVRFVPIYFNDVLFHEIDEYLSKFGFGLIYLLGSKYHATTGRLVEADALWVKKQNVKH